MPPYAKPCVWRHFCDGSRCGQKWFDRVIISAGKFEKKSEAVEFLCAYAHKKTGERLKKRVKTLFIKKFCKKKQKDIA